MKKVFLVIGKESQLGSILKMEIIAFLKQTKGFQEKQDEVQFSTNLSEPHVVRLRRDLRATDVYLVGLKAPVIPSYINKINDSIAADESVTYTVLCPEGVLKLVATELPVHCVINVHTTMKQLEPDIFSNQQKAKNAA